MIDQDVFNGTAETIYLTVTVTKPTAVMVAQSFVMDNAITNVTAPTCGDDCVDPSMLPLPYTSPMPAISTAATTLHFPAKIFEVVGGVPMGEIPCIAPCPTESSVFKFAIPPRATGQPARVFRVMTMIGQVSALWPSDFGHTASPPFFDEEIIWTNPFTNVTTTTRLTGLVDRTVVPERTGCVWPIPGPMGGCSRQGTKVPYRALRFATLTFASGTDSQYATAATAALAPVQAAPNKGRPPVATNDWSTSEGVLPNQP